MSLRSVSLSGDLDNNYLWCDLSSAAVISTPSTVTQDLYLYPYRHKTILSFVCFIPQSTEIVTQFLCDLINSRYQIDIRKWKCHIKRQCRTANSSWSCLRNLLTASRYNIYMQVCHHSCFLTSNLK